MIIRIVLRYRLWINLTDFPPFYVCVCVCVGGGGGGGEGNSCEKGLTHKRKIVLPREQILFFQSRPLFRWEAKAMLIDSLLYVSIPHLIC